MVGFITLVSGMSRSFVVHVYNNFLLNTVHVLFNCLNCIGMCLLKANRAFNTCTVWQAYKYCFCSMVCMCHISAYPFSHYAELDLYLIKQHIVNWSKTIVMPSCLAWFASISMYNYQNIERVILAWLSCLRILVSKHSLHNLSMYHALS